MKRFAFAAAAIAFTATGVLADAEASASEVASIKEALKAWCCCVDESVEKQNAPNVAFEVDDAECNGDQCDIKLDKDFTLLLLSRD